MGHKASTIPALLSTKVQPQQWQGTKKKKRVRVKGKKLLNLSLGDWIFLPIKSKKDYSQTDTLFTCSCRVQRTGQSFRELDDWVHNVSITKWLNLGRSVIALPTFRCKSELFKTIQRSRKCDLFIYFVNCIQFFADTQVNYTCAYVQCSGFSNDN